MRVAIEASRLAGERRGIGRYVRAVLPRLPRLDPALRLTLVTRGDPGPLRAWLARDPALAAVTTFAAWRDLPDAAPDVLWYPWNVLRPAPPTGLPAVATVHDAYPALHWGANPWNWRARWQWRRRYRATVARAARLVCVSRFTADECTRRLGADAARIRVTPLGADDVPTEPPADAAAVRQRLGVAGGYLLAVGTGERRKHFAALDRAMRRAVRDGLPARLVRAGEPGRDEAVGAPWRQDLGGVGDDALWPLYAGAIAVVVPSSYEGFGLPVLEAMRLGVPVIANRAASLPEVGGDAVRWVDADDPGAFAAALREVAFDRALRERLVEAGRARAATFRWEDTAAGLLGALREAARRDDAPRPAPEARP